MQALSKLRFGTTEVEYPAIATDCVLSHSKPSSQAPSCSLFDRVRGGDYAYLGDKHRVR
jgi:hypothetical protein